MTPSHFLWKSEYLPSFTGILSMTAGFTIYWFLAASNRIRNHFFNRYSFERASVFYFLFQKITGGVFMGILPGTAMLYLTPNTLTDLGLNLKNTTDSVLYSLIMGVIIIALTYFSTQNKSTLGQYPQMRIQRWNLPVILVCILGWGIYLISYEFLFRGILLMTCNDSFGFWPALAINLSLYSATHIPKGPGETMGALPYGMLLCFITISTGSLFTAFTTHWIMAVGNDLFSVKHHPEIKFE